MAEKQVQLLVLTPNRTVLDRMVDFVVLRTSQGDMGVLHGHAPCTAIMDYGVLRSYIDKRQTDLLAVMGGFVTVERNRVVVLSPLAEPPERMEQALADLEKEREENKQRERKSDLEIHRAETSLRRMLVQLDISPVMLEHDRGETVNIPPKRENGTDGDPL